MGEIAEAMINGEICEQCGVYLAPQEVVYLQSNGQKTTMPVDGSGIGVPVICKSCHNNK